MKKFIFSIALIVFISNKAKSEFSDSIANTVNLKIKRPELINRSNEFPSQLNKTSLWITAGTEAALYAGELVFLNSVWWGGREEEPVDFFFHNDNAGYLQIDKLGHFTTAYNESRLAYYVYRKTGLDKNSSLLIGGLTGFALQLPIEIWDGFYEKWGFSWGDIAANTLGACLFAGQEYFFDDQIVKMKFSFSHSEYARNPLVKESGLLGKTFGQSMSDDYNGHTYWASANLSKMLPKSNLPPWLNVAVGYSINGVLGEYHNYPEYHGVALPEFDRTRQFLFSLDVDWDKIPTHSKFMKLLFQGLDIIKIPFPALELNSQGKFKGYWLYF
jgi:hypothetical protein